MKNKFFEHIIIIEKTGLDTALTKRYIGQRGELPLAARQAAFCYAKTGKTPRSARAEHKF